MYKSVLKIGTHTVLSSSRSGRGPLKAKTGVRIPVGPPYYKRGCSARNSPFLISTLRVDENPGGVRPGGRHRRRRAGPYKRKTSIPGRQSLPSRRTAIL